MLSIVELNEKISKLVCHDTLISITDIALISEYMTCSAVVNKINNFKNLLLKHIDKETYESILSEYISELIPPGVKGSVRGKKFKEIVRSNLIFYNDRYIIEFNKNHPSIKTPEIPDFYIVDTTSNKSIIGIIRLDVWSGGFQKTTGSNYIFNEANTSKDSNHKFLCVVCNGVKIKSTKSKVYELMVSGLTTDSICYVTNLKEIIQKYFN